MLIPTLPEPFIFHPLSFCSPSSSAFTPYCAPGAGDFQQHFMTRSGILSEDSELVA